MWAFVWYRFPSTLLVGKLTNHRCFDRRATQDAKKKNASTDLTHSNIGRGSENALDAIFGPKRSFHLVVFNVCTLRQIGQQTALARITETHEINASCIPRTSEQDITSIINFHSPDTTLFSRFTFRLSDELVLSVDGHVGFRIPRSMRAERALLDWISVNSRLIAVWMVGFARASSLASPFTFTSWDSD